MVSKVVDVAALNFRSSAEVVDDNIIGTVYLGQVLKTVKEVDSKWISCSAEHDGTVMKGFVSLQFTRDLLSRNREKLVAQVHREWMRFKRGAGQEYNEPYASYVGEMWRALKIKLDGTDRDVPWSAAAISFMVKNSGSAYKNFNFAAAHSKFVHHAINARFDKDKSVPFWGYRLDEVRPEVGDIICRDNPDYAPAVNFDVAAKLNAYRSHTDIIMQIDSSRNKIIAIGGNVSQSVKIAEYDLTPGDYADDTRHTFALLKNIT